MEQIQEQLIQLLTIIIGGLLSIATIYVTIFINKYTSIAKEKAKQIKDENAQKKVNVALDRVNSLLTTNIVNAETTLKKELLKGIADNNFTKEDFVSLKESVINNVLKQLGDDSKNLLDSELGDLNGYISVKMEEILANLKEDPNSVVSHTEIK